MLEAAGDDIRGRRDRALILTGFAGAFRRSELVAVMVEDISSLASAWWDGCLCPTLTRKGAGVR